MSTRGLDRASRASRGKRTANLLDEEVEADDEFWNQEAFKDDVEDNEYAAEDEDADVFDSDFDEDDSDEEEEVEEQLTKKRKLPPEDHLEKKNKERNGSTEGVDTAHVASGGDLSHSALNLPDLSQKSHHQENGESTLDVEGERSVTNPTSTAVVIKQAEREAHEAALEALSKPVKKQEEERKISQEEVLPEATQTET